MAMVKVFRNDMMKLFLRVFSEKGRKRMEHELDNETLMLISKAEYVIADFCVKAGRLCLGERFCQLVARNCRKFQQIFGSIKSGAETD